MRTENLGKERDGDDVSSVREVMVPGPSARRGTRPLRSERSSDPRNRTTSRLRPRQGVELMTRTDDGRCVECGGRVFPDSKGFIACEDCGLQQTSSPIDFGSPNAPTEMTQAKSSAEQRATAERRKRRYDGTEKWTRSPQERRADRVKSAIEGQIHGLGLKEDQ